MKKFFGLLFTGVFLAGLAGCGGGGPASNVMEDVQKSDLEKYEEMLKAEEEEANKAMAAGMEAGGGVAPTE